MSKPKLMLTSLAMAFALLISVGIASSGATPSALLQETTSETVDETTAPGAAPVIPLASLAVPSPTHPWLTELRIPVILENDSQFTAPGDLSALGLLRFSVEDRDGNLYGLDTTRPARGAQPNHAVRSIEPGMTARWVLGFQVPTAVARGLTLVLHFGPEVVASWDVDSLPRRVTGSTIGNVAGTGFTLGDEIDWAEGVAVTPLEVGSLVCGDPAIETVTQIVAISFEVTNDGPGEVRWPGYIHRDGASVAQWADGTAADMSMETYVGDAETLPRVSTSAVRIPATVTSERALVFAAPRDGRFTNTSTLPAGVALRTGNGDAWLDLSGARATLPMSPAFCDLGFFGGPIPYGYGPGAKYEVGGEPLYVGAVPRDEAARELLTEALAGAALYYDAHGQSFLGVTGDALAARTPGVTFVGHDVGDDIDGDFGVVYFDTDPDEDDFLYVITRSSSGRWFCAGIEPHRAVTASDSMKLEEVSAVCFPETEEDDES